MYLLLLPCIFDIKKITGYIKENSPLKALGDLDQLGPEWQICHTVIDAPLKHAVQHLMIYRLKCSSHQYFVPTGPNIPKVYIPDYKYIFKSWNQSKLHVLYLGSAAMGSSNASLLP